MSFRAVLMLLFVFIIEFAQAQKFERKPFYASLSSEKIELIDNQLMILKEKKLKGIEGFEGALLMKKAGLLSKVKEKLSLFKKGHKLLEEAIKKNEANTELKFLRLIIQENAPRILNYNKELEKDSIFIRQNYNTLSSEIQIAILDYSKNSKVLKPSDFEK